MRDKLYNDIHTYRKIKSKILRQKYSQRGGALFAPNTSNQTNTNDDDMVDDDVVIPNDDLINPITNRPFLIPVSRVPVINDKPMPRVPLNPITNRPFLNPVSFVPEVNDKPTTPINPRTGLPYLIPQSYVPVTTDRPMAFGNKRNNTMNVPLKGPLYKGPSNPYMSQNAIMDEMAESSAGDLAAELGSLLLGLI